MSYKTKIIVIIVLSVFFLVSCTSTPTAMERANKVFVGRHIDDFVLQFGPPAGSHVLASQGNCRIYYFRLGSKLANTPSYSQTTVSGWSANTITTGGRTYELHCAIEVLTDENGEIAEITAAADTVGYWNAASRCAEVFTKTRLGLK